MKLCKQLLLKPANECESIILKIQNIDIYADNYFTQMGRRIVLIRLMIKDSYEYYK